MRIPPVFRCGPWLLLCLLPSLALAKVGTVTALEGAATRTPREGAPVALQEDGEIELGDTLEVSNGNLEVTLNDSSVLTLDAGAKLAIDDARFEGLERKGFSARLLLGTLWAKVSKALSGSDANFEVHTERAVAGVRGTSFIVEVDGADAERPTHVEVLEGRVDVSDAVQPIPLAVEAKARLPGGPRPVHVESLVAGDRLSVHRDGRHLRARGFGVPKRFQEFLLRATERRKHRHGPANKVERHEPERRHERERERGPGRFR